jgi:hypothetical protein
MPDTRKILLISGVIVVIVASVVGVIFALKKKKSKDDSSVEVKIYLKGPITSESVTQYYNKNKLSSFTIGDFLGQTVSKLLPYKAENVYWESITISSQTVFVSDGKIPDSIQSEKLSILLGGIPNSISLNMLFKRACVDKDLEEMQTHCDPCKAQKAICTSTGPICMDNMLCPTGPALYNCCTGVHNYALCKDGIIKCGGCTGTADCGDPGCSGIGPLCTSTGWTCVPGQTCATGASLQSCCTVEGEYASCKYGNLTCSSCTGPIPDYTPDCNMKGIKCTSTGYAVADGITCPPPDVLNTCCASTPNTPMGYCATGATGVQCKDCGPVPTTGCPQSCGGDGWVCTATGWLCLPNVKCPNDMSICCVPPYTPYCDSTTNCVKCTCPSGQHVCSNPNCSTSAQTQCQITCCDNDIPCTSDPETGACICCTEAQMCSVGGVPVCCPLGTMCVGGTNCEAICGMGSDNKPITCKEGQACSILENLSPENIAKLQQQYGNDVTIHGTTAYLCMNNSGQCQFLGNEVAVPAPIDNYYPCYSFPTPSVLDPNNPGPGYCTEISGTPTGKCATTHSTSKECNADSACTWRNILKFMASNYNTNTSAEQIQKEIGVIQHNANGNYCDTSNSQEAFSRVVVFAEDPSNSNCDWTNCWTQVSQPDVTDIDYNSSTKLCVALQSCNKKGTGPTSYIKTNKGITEPNPNITKLPSYATNPANSIFPSCSGAACPIFSTDAQHACYSPSGQIVPVTYKCNTDPNVVGGQVCQLTYDGSGKYSHDTCNFECGCAPGYTRNNSNNKCYQNIFVARPVQDYGACSDQCISSSCHADRDDSCGDGWIPHCSGGCESESCSCYCIAKPTPMGYMYCPRGGPWTECTTGNCQSGLWGSSTGGNCNSDTRDETGIFCK